MRAIVGDVIGTTDGRFGTVVCDDPSLLVQTSVEDGSETFEITQAEVASIR